MIVLYYNHFQVLIGVLGALAWSAPHGSFSLLVLFCCLGFVSWVCPQEVTGRGQGRNEIGMDMFTFCEALGPKEVRTLWSEYNSILRSITREHRNYGGETCHFFVCKSDKMTERLFFAFFCVFFFAYGIFARFFFAQALQHFFLLFFGVEGIFRFFFFLRRTQILIFGLKNLFLGAVQVIEKYGQSQYFLFSRFFFFQFILFQFTFYFHLFISFIFILFLFIFLFVLFLFFGVLFCVLFFVFCFFFVRVVQSLCAFVCWATFQFPPLCGRSSGHTGSSRLLPALNNVGWFLYSTGCVQRYCCYLVYFFYFFICPRRALCIQAFLFGFWYIFAHTLMVVFRLGRCVCLVAIGGT